MVTSPQPHELGYTYASPRHPNDPGSPRLDILIRAQPTGLHFDPERVDFPTLVQPDTVETLTIDHPWTGLKQFRLYPGRILMYDHQNKVARAFTFGGSLEVTPSDLETLCTVQSSAPILNLTLPQSLAVILAEEVETLLASYRARWADQIEHFQQRVGATDPLTLYQACLNSLRQRFEALPAGVEGIMQKFSHFLHVESQELQAEHNLPAHSDTLEELFSR